MTFFVCFRERNDILEVPISQQKMHLMPRNMVSYSVMHHTLCLSGLKINFEVILLLFWNKASSKMMISIYQHFTLSDIGCSRKKKARQL